MASCTSAQIHLSLLIIWVVQSFGERLLNWWSHSYQEISRLGGLGLKNTGAARCWPMMWGRWGGLRCLHMHVDCSHCVVKEKKESQHTPQSKPGVGQKNKVQSAHWKLLLPMLMSSMKWANWLLKMQKVHCVHETAALCLPSLTGWQGGGLTRNKQQFDKAERKEQGGEGKAVGGPKDSPWTLVCCVRGSLSAFSWIPLMKFLEFPEWFVDPPQCPRISRSDSAHHESQSSAPTQEVMCQLVKWRVKMWGSGRVWLPRRRMELSPPLRFGDVEDTPLYPLLNLFIRDWLDFVNNESRYFNNPGAHTVQVSPLSPTLPSPSTELISADQDPVAFDHQVLEPNSISPPVPSGGLRAANLRATTTAQCAPTPTSPSCTANSSGRAWHKNCSPLNVKAIRDSIRAAEHSGNHTPNTCAQEYPEGPKSAELMRENIRAPQVCALERLGSSTGTQHP